MHAIARRLPAKSPPITLATLTFVAGGCGMAISFLFLASNHYLDVTAGAAGFVAGSVLVAAGLISISVQRPFSPADSLGTAPANDPANLEPAMDATRWLAHFRANREKRPEPDWAAPITLSAAAIEPLVRSLEQFQLGDGGGPAYLIARDRERFLAAAGTRQLVDMWFTEEREHARLLGEAVARFGGQCIDNHWSFQVFCMTRRWLGVRFELTVLLLTEIVSTVYYKLLFRHGQDAALRSMSRLILRDEIGHVSFHRDRLARRARSVRAEFGLLWAIWFRSLGLAAATMLWVNHAAGLKALGATRKEFYREVWRELSQFISRLRMEAAG